MAKRFCIIGLGNPGPKYSQTRHNIGFDWVDAAAASLMGPSVGWVEKFDALWVQAEILGCELHFLKPLTFMNLSGQSLRKWSDKYQGPAGLLVVLDDLDLPLGKLRLRTQGGDGGHRGLRSIIECMATEQIPRLRVGIGRPAGETVDYVLERFHPDDKPVVKAVLAQAGDHTKLLLADTFEKAMNKINALDFGAPKAKS